MKRIIKFSFKPEKKGFNQLLGKLEEKILLVLWQEKEVTGREIFEKISQEKKIAYTTVLTVLDRLVKKGLVIKDKKGEVYSYRAAFNKNEFTDYISQQILRGVFDLSERATFSSFVEILSEFDPQRLDLLSSIINRKKRELKGK
ncbi:MAG: BlaI/MecI/CopY family transcriptional regulator [Candidatus Aminicenantia bacterium]